MFNYIEITNCLYLIIIQIDEEEVEHEDSGNLNFLTPFDQSPAKNTRSRATSDAPKFSQETDGAVKQSLLRQEMSTEKSTVYQIMDINVPEKL